MRSSQSMSTGLGFGTQLRFYILALTPAFLAILAGVTYREFVVHAITTNIVINIIILGTAALGMVLMMVTISGIMREWRGFALLAAGPLEARARANIAQLLGARLICHLDDLRGRHLSLLDQGHVHQEIDELREGLTGRQELGQYLVGLMVALGLLGTFIGLLETLVGVGQLIGSFGSKSGSLDESFRALLANLQRPLAAMGTAFAASMFGLIGSLLLGLVQIVVRSAQAGFMDYAHGVTNRIVHIPEANPPAPASEASPAWLLATMDSLAAVQRDSVDQVGALQELAMRNERRVEGLAGVVAELARLQAETVRAAGAHAEQMEGTMGYVRDAVAAIEHRIGETVQIVNGWRRDLARSHAVGLRYLGRALRHNSREMSRTMHLLGDGNGQLIAELSGDRDRAERAAMRDQKLLLDAWERLADQMDGLHRRAEERDALLERALATQNEELVRRLETLQALCARSEFDATVPERLLLRVDALERRILRDLQVAVKALSSEAGLHL